MALQRYPPDDPREWLQRARSNLIRAKNRQPGIYLEDLCFDAQQAAEKAFKAVCIYHDIKFPHVHDLGKLMTVIEENADQSVPERIQQAGRLSRYAITTRYPGLVEPVSEEDYDQAVAIAQRVVQWARKTVYSE